MLPRNPLIFKICTICATILFLGVLLYSREPSVVMTRSVVLLRQENFAPTAQSKMTSPSYPSDMPADKSGDNVSEPQPTASPTTTTTELPTSPAAKSDQIVDGETLDFVMDLTPCDETIYLMIYVHSGPENAERRRVIRKTWASEEILKQHKAKLVFVMGEVHNEDIQASLENENEVHKDIIQGNFTDTYRNLTYKAITGLRWASKNCDKAVYVLKTDDDIVVDIHRVVRLMHSHIEKKWGTSDLLAGYVWTHMNVDRNKSSKWYTSPEEFPKDFFLKYCSGSAFIMTPDVVKKFYLKSRETPFFWIDDYYVTGMLAHSSEISPKAMNDRYFLHNDGEIMGSLADDAKTRLVYIHSPNTTISLKVWQKFLDRW